MITITDTKDSFQVNTKQSATLELQLNVSQYGRRWSHIGDEMGPAKLYYINDFRSISGFSPVVSNYLFKSNVSFITSALEKHENCIIITHHAPSMKCISDKYLGDKLNCCFASDLEYLFKHTHMMGWIYGHTHHNHKEIGERVFLYGNCYRATNYMNESFI
jgi:hypothetical protein